MSENIEKAPNVPPFVTFVTSAVPMVFDNSLSYYEALCALWKWLQDDVVNVINNNATVTEEYIQLTNDMKEYMDNYFDNLDVQEEINNKLDAMVEDGTLQELINAYLQPNVTWTFDTVADMAASTNLVDGGYARTLGFYSINDDGGGIYKIDTTGTANGMDIIAVGDLNAHLQTFNNSVNVKQLGAKGDGTTNDHDIIAAAFSVADTVIFSKASYKILTPIVLSNLSDINIIGNEATLLGDGFASSSTGNHGWLEFDTCTNIKIDGLNIDGDITWAARPYSWESGSSTYNTNRDLTYDGYRFISCSNVKVYNCTATKIKVGYHFSIVENGVVDNCKSIKTMADGVLLHNGCKNIHVSNHYVEDGNDDQFTMLHDLDDTSYVENCSYLNCTAKNSFGACAVMLECMNCNATNCTSIGNKDVPIKLGTNNTNSGSFAGKNNVMDNITVETSNTIYGNNTSLSQAQTNGVMQMYGGNGSNVTSMSNCMVINSRFIETSGNNLSLLITRQNGYQFKNCVLSGINLIGTTLTSALFEDCDITSKDGNLFTTCTGVVFRNCKITYDESYQARGKRSLQFNNCSNIIVDDCKLSGSTHTDTRTMSLYADDTTYTNVLVNINAPFTITAQTGVYSDSVIILDDAGSYGYQRFKAGQLIFFTSNNTLYLVKSSSWVLISS